MRKDETASSTSLSGAKYTLLFTPLNVTEYIVRLIRGCNISITFTSSPDTSGNLPNSPESVTSAPLIACEEPLVLLFKVIVLAEMSPENVPSVAQTRPL